MSVCPSVCLLTEARHPHRNERTHFERLSHVVLAQEIQRSKAVVVPPGSVGTVVQIEGYLRHVANLCVVPPHGGVVGLVVVWCTGVRMHARVGGGGESKSETEDEQEMVAMVVVPRVRAEGSSHQATTTATPTFTPVTTHPPHPVNAPQRLSAAGCCQWWC